MSLEYDARAVIDELMRLLDDRYKSGFPVLKEMLQNADDAGAKRVVINAHDGFPGASHPLLTVPALLIANDGPATQGDLKAMQSMSGSTKIGDTAKVGRFGLGQKAVFNLCDAFVVHGRLSTGGTHQLVVNPYGKLDLAGNQAHLWSADPTADAAFMDRWLNTHGFSKDGVLLVIPLRSETVRPAPRVGLTTSNWTTEAALADFATGEQLHAALAGLGCVEHLEIHSSRSPITYVVKSLDGRLSRPSIDAPSSCNKLGGSIIGVAGCDIRFVGREQVLSSGRAVDLHRNDKWPTRMGLDHQPIADKAVAHGGVIVSRSFRRDSGPSCLRIHWSVFLPVGAEAEAEISLPEGMGTFDLALHGYFFLDSGRQRIDFHSNPDDVKASWNAALRDEATLPLFFESLIDCFKAFALAPMEKRALVNAIQNSSWWREHQAFAAGNNALAEGWAGSGSLVWAVQETNLLRPIPVPKATDIGALIRALPGIDDWVSKRGLVLTSGAVLSGQLFDWTSDELADIVRLAGPAAFQRQVTGEMLADLLMPSSAATSEPVRDALATSLRSALLDAGTDMRATASIARLVGLLNDSRLIRLPAGVDDRQLLAALADGSGRIPVKHAWMPTDHGLRLEVTEAIDLLDRLEPFVTGDGERAEQAGRIVSEILRQGLGRLATHPRAQNIRVVAATLVLDGSRSFLTLAELNELANAGLLFGRQPGSKLNVLAEAVLRPPVYRVQWTADDGPLVPRSAQRASDLIGPLVAARQFGDARARGQLLTILASETVDRDTLRKLAAGQTDLGPDAELVELDQLPTGLAPLIDWLTSRRSRLQLIPEAVSSQLNAEMRTKLGIQRLDAPTLARWLTDAAGQELDGAISDDVAQALLLSGIEANVLEQLPLHRARNGRRVAQRDGIWQAKVGEIPPSLVSEAAVLEPWNDPQVQALQFRTIPRWGPEALVRCALGSERPASHADSIIDALQALPDLGTLESALCETAWLPFRGGSIEPRNVLDLSPETDAALRRLVGHDAAFATPAEVPLLAHNGEILRKLSLLPDRSESLGLASLMVGDIATIGCIVDPAIHLRDLSVLARANFNCCLEGWDLLSAALRSSEDAANVLPLAQALFGTIDGRDLVAHLNALAGTATTASASEAANRLHRSAFERHWHRLATDGAVPASLLLPSRSGAFLRADALALAAEGVAPGFVLDTGYAKQLLEHRTEDVAPDSAGVRAASEETATFHIDLAKHLEAWRHHIPADAIQFILALLGRDEGMRQLAQNWPAQRSFDQMCRDIDSALDDIGLEHGCIQTRLAEVPLSLDTARSGRVSVLSAAGTLCDVPLDETADSWLMEVIRLTPERNAKGVLMHPHRLVVSERIPEDDDAVQRLALGFVKSLSPALTLALPSQHQPLLEQMAALFGSDQTALAEAEAELRDVVAERLRGLKVSGAARAALDRYDDVPPRKNAEAKEQLWSDIRSPECADDLLAAVRRRIEEMGYSDSRAIFELFQNADDALEHWPSQGQAGTFRVEVLRDEAGAIRHLRVVHWGRLINHPGDNAAVAKKRQHSRDLPNMLAIGHSGKDGDGQTGRFGLGFKTVHMLSSEAAIASGRITLRLSGGFAPVPWPEGRLEARKYAVGGEQATLIDLPIDSDHGDAAATALNAFREAATWLPAIAPRVRKIEIDDGAQSATYSVTPTPLAPAVEVVKLTGEKQRRAFRISLGNGFRMLMPFGRYGPEGLPEGTPRFWHLVPLEERSQSQWIMDGPFDVDPGRTRIKGDDLEAFEGLGLPLGARLIELFDAVKADWPEFCTIHDIAADRELQFWTALVERMRSDVSSERESRLHGQNRGLARLLAERPLVAAWGGDNIRAADAKWRLSGVLINPEVKVSVEHWPPFANAAQTCVDEATANLLRQLQIGHPTELTMERLLADWIGEAPIEPGMAAQLGAVINADSIKGALLTEQPQILQLLAKTSFRTETGQAQSIRSVAFPYSDDERHKAAAAFAPPSHRLAAEYSGPGLALAQQARRETGHNQNEWIAWAKQAETPARRQAYLRYIMQSDRWMANILYDEAISWLPPRHELAEHALLADWSPGDRQLLLTLIGQVLFQTTYQASTSWVPINAGNALREIGDWWSGEREELVASYERATYPEDFHPLQLQESEDREQWFTMFALAAFHTIGRSNPGAGRNFIDAARREGWWAHLASSRGEDPEPWIGRLRAWSEPWLEPSFQPWKQLLVDLHMITRHLDSYRDTFVRLPRIVAAKGKVSLDGLLRPATSTVAMEMGSEGASVNRALGIGANWMVRELSRTGFWSSDATTRVAPYAWMTTARLRRLWRRLDLADPGHGIDYSPGLYQQIVTLTDEECAWFGGDLDLALQTISHSRHLDDLNAILLDDRDDAWTAFSETDDDE